MVTRSSVPMQLAWPCGLPWSSWAQPACLHWSLLVCTWQGNVTGLVVALCRVQAAWATCWATQGQEILVSARNLVRGRRWGRWKIGQLLLQRHFSATFSTDLSQQIYTSPPSSVSFQSLWFCLPSLPPVGWVSRDEGSSWAHPDKQQRWATISQGYRLLAARLMLSPGWCIHVALEASWSKVTIAFRSVSCGTELQQWLVLGLNSLKWRQSDLEIVMQRQWLQPARSSPW